MAEIRDLLARLQSPSESRESPSAFHLQPSVSSAVTTPSPAGPQPHHSSAIISPNTSALNTPAPEPTGSGSSRNTDLLSLLKFGQGSGSQGVASSPTAPTTNIDRPLPSSIPPPIRKSSSDSQAIQDRPFSAADLLASFVRKPTGIGSVQMPSPAPPMASRPELRGEASSSSTSPQNFLLNLLNQASTPSRESPVSLRSGGTTQSQSLQAEMHEAIADNLVQGATREAPDDSPLRARDDSRKSSPVRVFGEPTKQPSAFDPPQPAVKGNVFTYVNPFEQLSASSPRNRTPKPQSRTTTPKAETTKGRDTSQDISSSTSQSRKISPEYKSSTPEPVAFTPPSATIPRPETVSEALGEVGEQVHKEVAEALAQATSTTHGDSMSGTSELEKAVSEAATEIKEELKPEDIRKETEVGMSKSMAEAFEVTIETVAEAPEVDADSQDPVAKSPGVVRVFNFPMRPFFAIEIKKLDEPPARITTEMMSDISRLKKDFDQIDRNLVAATVNHIVYPLKNGGFRVIRQDTGEHTQVFQACKERVFNVAVGRNLDKENEIETVLATGVDGSVFWTSLINYQGDENYGSEHESRGFILPPMPSGDDNHAGGQLKTRVKASTRHPSFFAYGRGKSIYIIWPSVARSTYFTNDKRICDSERYLKDRCLKIQTGKAAKDFTFSADDTVVASLDKVGKIKFWDIRSLTESKFDATYQDKHHEVVNNPILMLATHMQDQKMWPTSLMFLDKERPMAKGIALRYLVVGMKQNHTLQLWDLSLQKAVQEINFPHEGESDAICSLAYHPKTGILVVGHPTRNSIYLLHVSSPKYNLSPMSQAKYLNMVASRDKSLPAPDSTIIVSGVREFSLGQKGELRSLDIMDDAAEKYSLNDPPFFDLYVMHSKGITDIAIQREHLGWSKEGKILNPVDAVDTRAISLKALTQPPQSLPGDDSTTNGTTAQLASSTAKPGREPSTRAVAARVRELEVVATPATPPVENVTGAEKHDKKKKKKAADVSSPAPTLTTPNRSKSPMAHISIEREAGPLTKATDSDVPAWASQLLAARKPVPFTVNDDETKTTLAGFEQSMNVQFSNLFRKIADDRRVQEAASAAKQEAVLHLVSSTLSENVEQVMDKIVNEAINKTMFGPFKDVLIQNIDRSLTDAFSQSMKASLPREIEKTLPPALRGVLENQALIRHISDRVTTAVQNEVRVRFETAYADILAPGFRNLAIQSTKSVADEIERRVIEQLRNAEMQRKNDSAKIDHLVKQVNSLQEVLGTLAQDQSRFQTQLINYLRQVQQPQPPPATATQVAEPSSSRSQPMSTPQKTKEEMEVDEISQLLNSGNYEAATVKWLKSDRQVELFDEIFFKIQPQILEGLTPLVILSVGAAVTLSFTLHQLERIDWLKTTLRLVDPKDAEFADVFPKIMDIISGRLHQAYMEIAVGYPRHPALMQIQQIAVHIQEMRNVAIVAATQAGATF